MALEPILQQLINELRTLPGVGPKSAQRMAFYLLSRNRQGGKQLGESLLAAMQKIQFCQNCRHFTQNVLCSFCVSTQRQSHLLCIVENPADLIALEQTGYQGLYFVLHGRLSPLDGIGPAQLGLDMLKQTLQKNTIQEMILATNPTVEGEATAHYLAQMAKHYNIKCTRLAHGIPLGGELEYLDGGTLTHAFTGRELV